jgi:hypothetical protein
VHLTGELAVCVGSSGPGNLHLINQVGRGRPNDLHTHFGPVWLAKRGSYVLEALPRKPELRRWVVFHRLSSIVPGFNSILCGQAFGWTWSSGLISRCASSPPVRAGRHVEPAVIPAAARLHARGRGYLSAGGSRNRY